MKIQRALPSLFLVAALTSLGVRAAEPAATLTLDATAPGVAINRGMWGLFFEDINFGADGGLYAELVKNRSFEFPEPLMGWKSEGVADAASVLNETPFSTVQPHYLHLKSGGVILNEGFRGIGVKAGEKYDFSVQTRAVSGQPSLRVELIDSSGKVLAGGNLKSTAAQWRSLTLALRPGATEARARLKISVVGEGTLDLDMVSLFPRKTWKNRPGGLRADMVQLLADLKPGFLRFPGGCIVEGDTLATRYQWKNTIGPVAERRGQVNHWSYQLKHRPTPDYYQSFGLGFFEYFQLCEDIGAAPLPILNCGMSCQFMKAELCALDDLGPYIQDALDLVEFANGPVTSTWGAKRAAMGHPAPFNLRMIGIGNEHWDQQYLDRYTEFHEALKAKHPEITLVSSAGPSPGGKRFDFSWKKLRELGSDIVDEHCYEKPDWFFKNAIRYDKHARPGPKVFFGEYAAQSDKILSLDNRNNWECALSEAAFMTGLERNGDVVTLASYAPLFAHIDAWQWTPNLIWVDNLRSYGTPNYYVQKLFANHAGDVAVPLTLTTGEGVRLFASATRDGRSGEWILKVVNAGDVAIETRLALTGSRTATTRATGFTLTSENMKDENSFAEPLKISPQPFKLDFTLPESTHTFPSKSLTVLRVKM